MKTLYLLFNLLTILLVMSSFDESDLNHSNTHSTPDYLISVATCDLPPEPGLCLAAFLRYYYNSETGTCETFTYGGCGGNANNYMSFNACISACGDICQLEPESGPCEAAIPRFYYNSETGTCETFIYGGCGGNANNYESFNVCISTCGDVCQLEPEIGDCDGYFPRYYYDTGLGTCKRFDYGGCGGNANNYESFTVCISACGNVCQLKPDPGPCDQALERWYFNDATGHCEEFIYGGCEGNENRYLSMALCRASCGDVCYLPAEIGDCDAAIPRYFFNPNTGVCELFAWGGCGGNANKYETYQECMNSCADVCDMPADSGPCEAAIPRYYFNRMTGNCQSFIFGGCGGNENNFMTLAACQAACPCEKIVHDDEWYGFMMNESKSASRYLTSRSILTDNSDISYSANEFILLLPGFTVEEQATLTIMLNGCID